MIKMKTNNKFILLPILFLGLAIIFSFSVQSVAADSSAIYVNTSGNDAWNGQSATHTDPSSDIGPKKTIADAVNTVDNNGNVYIANGVYNENSIDITKSMNIIGESPDNTIINAQNQGNIFTTQNNINVDIENIYFTNGNNRDGGAIYNTEGQLTINNCKFFTNNANSGGAVYSISNTVNVENSGFSGNKACNGGAIFVTGGNLYVTNDVFTRNSATTGTGGSIYGTGANLIGTNDYFVNNNAVCSGGAIHETGYLDIVNSNFVTNRISQEYGGAIFHTGSTISLINSHFTGNTALVGGAVTNVQSDMTINNCNFTSNTADGRGGAIVNTLGSLTITGSYFISNVAKIGFGGALYHSTGVLSFSNNTFSRNIAQEGGAGIYVACFGNSKIDKNIFTYNQAARGSALYDFNGILNVSNSNFTGNSASANGGAVYNDNTGLAKPNDSTINFSKCIFHDNVATQFGGALYNGGAINLSYCTLTNNKATDGHGGAVANAQGIVTVNYSTLCYNSAKISGGVIYSNLGHLAVTNNIFHDNTGVGVAPYQNNGIYYWGATVTILNNKFV